MNKMDAILKYKLPRSKAALWFLGQAGYVARAGKASVVIDPYLSDSVGRVAPDFKRAYPVPLRPSDLAVDVFIVTHDHLDHLDPDTVAAYRHTKETLFVAPHLAARKLVSLGVPEENVQRLDCGETLDCASVKLTGVYAVPTSADVVDTTGYRVEFANGRSFYHTSDTAYSDVVAAAAPKSDVLLACINGKYGNLNVAQAVKLAAAMRPRYAIPNHYDVMALNAENPESFRYFVGQECPDVAVRILKVLEPFVW